ncbi:MAG TPA: hypothetical protein VMT46_02225 [Anaerolineaceae bacterium]|nr:hypothetical protein [Anaerolineaceae bacterium]
MAANAFQVKHALSLALIGVGLIIIAVGLGCLAYSMRIRFYRPKRNWRRRAYSLCGLGTSLALVGAVV